MKRIQSIFCFTIILLGCQNQPQNASCPCCDTTFTSITSAINCFNVQVDSSATSIDNRLLLLAFISKDLETCQNLGWSIIGDEDIIRVAKKNYALVILDVNQINVLSKGCGEIGSGRRKKYADEPFFVIANSALCAFGDWSLHNSKDEIIDKLRIGNGP